MIPINTFTFVIGYRHSIDRLNNLKRTLDWINGFSGSQVLLIEQDSHSKISHFNLRCEHIFVKSKMPYNRSLAFNIGMKYAKSNIVVCGDSDLIMRPEDFIQGLKLLDQYEMVSPYNSVVDLTPQENNLPIENIQQTCAYFGLLLLSTLWSNATICVSFRLFVHLWRFPY